MTLNKIKELISRLTTKKGSSVMVVIGIAGIIIIGLSGIFESKDTAPKDTVGQALTNEQYCDEVEQKIKDIVTALTGDKRPSVVVTLDTGVKYIYADQTKKDSKDNSDITGDATKTQKSDSTENGVVIVKDSLGGQTALKVTEFMPTVRGVTVICDGGNYERVANNITMAVMTALDITEGRVFVTGK